MTENDTPEGKVVEEEPGPAPDDPVSPGEGAGDSTDRLLGKAEGLAQKGMQALVAGVGKIGELAQQTTRAAMLQVELRQARARCGDLETETGKKIWEMKKAGSLPEIGAALEEESRRMATLRAAVAEIESRTASSPE